MTLWLDGSARCPLPIVAQADAVRLLEILPVAPGQRVPYAYTDLFCFQGSQPFSPSCDFIIADSNTVSEYPVVTVPCGFVTVWGLDRIFQPADLTHDVLQLPFDTFVVC